MRKHLIAKCLLGLVLFCAHSNSLFADVASDDGSESVETRIELINADAFPGFDFYLMVPAETDFWGYESDSLESVHLSKGEIASTGGYGYRSPVFARDSAGNIYKSIQTVGGSVTEYDVDFAYYVKQIEVLSVMDGVVKIRVVARLKMNYLDEVMEVKKGSIVDFSGTNWYLTLLPAVCLLAMVAFYLLRGRPDPAQAGCTETVGSKS